MGYRTYTCPIARRCGGCEWLSVPYPIQLRRKQKSLERLFGDICHEDGCQISPVRGMEDPRAFRMKAAAPFAPGPKGRIRTGFYEGGSHRIVWCERCLVEDERARAVLNDVARVAERLGIAAYDEDRGTGVLRHAVLRCGHATDETLLTLVTNGERLPRARRFVRELLKRHGELTSIVQNVNTRRTNAILGQRCRTLYGPGIMRDRLLGCTFEIGPTSFYQTNPRQTELLYSLVAEGARLSGGERVLDAYCGCGTIGICLAKAVREAERPQVRVTGVEQVSGAVASARRNAAANGLKDCCTFVNADATEYLRRAAVAAGGATPDGDGRFDVVVMDPPRAGSTPAFIASVAACAPRTVVYVSCNPQTQVRDLAELRRHGYRVTDVTPVDMFPHTKHVETVCLLSKLDVRVSERKAV
ncbi:23S rRNA (uracil(1939)-C(5))-methyltransferase RlmD [Olsenella sp. HMSC062G07]|uniref:23S rRNA (uracil(1939)-C(5))-methyltransferase RlmD n=1 Tax=Olsenella sp. HMSC062G07 TaxID=1739330 RepID=UPI0008A62A35|nr:23S rRNA (uracil(1939)-C(5))-methyltransferase RlmD [Olsenella sp. HMSC062G07]OFK22179.1 23S rRNA (uracil-5-)-methyltransferase RumA [Olsenella sp. HMSC062G07]